MSVIDIRPCSPYIIFPSRHHTSQVGFFCLFFLKLWTLSGEAKDAPTRLTSHQPNLPQIDLIFEMGLCVSFGSSQSNTSEQKGSSFYFLLHWFVISPKALKVGKISCGFGKCWYFIISYFVVYWFIIFLQVAWNTLSSWWHIANGIKLSQVHHRLELTICTGHDIYNTHTHTLHFLLMNHILIIYFKCFGWFTWILMITWHKWMNSEGGSGEILCY